MHTLICLSTCGMSVNHYTFFIFCQPAECRFNQIDWLREIAIVLFQQERISLSRASKIAAMEVMNFQKLLADCGMLKQHRTKKSAEIA